MFKIWKYLFSSFLYIVFLLIYAKDSLEYLQISFVWKLSLMAKLYLRILIFSGSSVCQTDQVFFKIYFLVDIMALFIARYVFCTKLTILKCSFLDCPVRLYYLSIPVELTSFPKANMVCNFSNMIYLYPSGEPIQYSAFILAFPDLY